ncbi:MAG: hypothetical protein HY961_16485 [Ignavibacteriae bacterium]|nr:hypothetical protein [Ignavibacteriota bacterium]
MARKLASDMTELLARADADTKNTRAKPQPVAQRAPEQDARRIYSGDVKPKNPGYAARPSNKKITPKKRRSTFSIISVLFFAAIAIVLYIGNILIVNELVVDVHRLRTKYDTIVNENNVLKSEINRKSAWERVSDKAKDLGLAHAREAAQSFDVDEEKLEEFREK